MTAAPDAPFAETTDEELARLAGAGIDAAERALLRRQMQAIYWLPRRAFGADEEELADFLVYAVEKIRKRHLFAKFDPDRGVRFASWFGVVLRRLYLDYLRQRDPAPPALELKEEVVAAPDAPEAVEAASPLLASLGLRCRVLFKLLLCHTQVLEPDELAWIATESGRTGLETLHRIAELETRLRANDAALSEKYDRLAAALWWKQTYERQLHEVERALDRPWTEEHPKLRAVYRKLVRKRDEVARAVERLEGGAGLVTAPYRDLADLLEKNESTLASWISRCRAGAAREWKRLTEADDDGA